MMHHTSLQMDIFKGFFLNDFCLFNKKLMKNYCFT